VGVLGALGVVVVVAEAVVTALLGAASIRAGIPAPASGSANANRADASVKNSHHG
jgi:hypothetical protein